MLGTERIRTTAYHPASNGLVERFHRQLKAALRAHENPDWYETLPLVLLGIRTCLKADIQCTAAELVFGTTLRLPGEFFTPRSSASVGVQTYVERLSTYMRALPPAKTRIQHRQVLIPSELSTCTHVFIRVDSVRKPLQQPYEGPFRVISRHDKTFKVDRHGRVDTISIDRLKPAYVDDDAMPDNMRPSANPSQPLNETAVSRSSSENSSSATTLNEAPASHSSRQSSRPATTSNETPVSLSSRQFSSPATAFDEASASRHSRQLDTPATVSNEVLTSRSNRQTSSTSLTTNETSVSRSSQPCSHATRPSNETYVSRSGRRIVLPARFRT